MSISGTPTKLAGPPIIPRKAKPKAGSAIAGPGMASGQQVAHGGAAGSKRPREGTAADANDDDATEQQHQEEQHIASDDTADSTHKKNAPANEADEKRSGDSAAAPPSATSRATASTKPTTTYVTSASTGALAAPKRRSATPQPLRDQQQQYQGLALVAGIAIVVLFCGVALSGANGEGIGGNPCGCISLRHSSGKPSTGDKAAAQLWQGTDGRPIIGGSFVGTKAQLESMLDDLRRHRCVGVSTVEARDAATVPALATRVKELTSAGQRCTVLVVPDDQITSWSPDVVMALKALLEDGRLRGNPAVVGRALLVIHTTADLQGQIHDRVKRMLPRLN